MILVILAMVYIGCFLSAFNNNKRRRKIAKMRAEVDLMIKKNDELIKKLTHKN